MTQREIDLVLGRLDRMDEYHQRDREETRAQLDRIEEHAGTTNGRVSSLELWKARVMGAAALIGGLATIGTPLAIAFLT